MKYHVTHIETSFAEEWQGDVFAQALCDLGFDTIENSAEAAEGGKQLIDAYIQSALWEGCRAETEKLCAETEGVRLISVEPCPDENWNAVWEAEHPVIELPLGVTIVPHCAFGAGHHETTSMMVEQLIDAFGSHPSAYRRVLDHGTGTGILAIFAKRLGAEQVVAVDIDEKSVANARENAARNGVEIEVLHTSAFRFEPDSYQLILANIHRNILLEHMPLYAQALRVDGELWMSGFYEEDCPTLTAAAAAEGLEVIGQHAAQEWRMMRVVKNSQCKIQDSEFKI